MRLLIIIVGIFCCINSSNAQNEGMTRFRNVPDIPASQTNTTVDIAAFIAKDNNTDIKKIHAIYSWVTNNIKYDKDSIHRVILDEDNEERVTYALKRRKGVCENFAAIFNDICQKSGINSFAIEGYTKQNGSIDRTPHVWCAAFVDNKWALYDPTWDAGFISSGRFVSQVQTNYFQRSPEDFIQTHFPFDPMFQFLSYPVTYKEFYRGDTRINNSKSYFNYMDSIGAYKNQDPLTQYLSTVSRIKNAGWPAAMVDTKLKRIKLEIELIYQDKDMALYNSAITDYNEGVAIFNNFLTYRNNQFKPAKTSDEIQDMFNSITKKIATANQKLNEVNKSTATLVLDTGDIQKKLTDLSVNIKEQETFFKNYLSSAK